MQTVLIIETIFIMLGAGILAIGMFYALQIIQILRKEHLDKSWLLLTILIAFFFGGYAFIGLRFMDVIFLPEITIEIVVALVFFFGGVFVVLMTYLNRNLFQNIFGLDLTDSQALEKFSQFINLPDLDQKQITKAFEVKCDVCEQVIIYSIPDIVRSHPKLSRGIFIKDAMGNKTYTFYIRHRCANERREIPVLHDHSFEYRSKKRSRII